MYASGTAVCARRPTASLGRVSALIDGRSAVPKVTLRERLEDRSLTSKTKSEGQRALRSNRMQSTARDERT